jgi:uncharacterized protein YecE (DUF72 family)
MEKGAIYIGTSGWFYEHWDTTFYPEKFPKLDRLPFYANFFSTVEINSTYYHLPKDETIKSWLERTPSDFIFSVKANRLITHQKKLLDFETTTATFFQKIMLFKGKIGPILFLLPPSFTIDTKRLEAFLDYLPRNNRYAFEFRNPSWYTKKTFQLLKKYNCSFCIGDLNGILSPFEITSDLAYIRLHGPERAYKGFYSEKQIDRWADCMKAWSDEGLIVFCYFNNDEAGYATQDAQKLKNRLSLEKAYM